MNRKTFILFTAVLVCQMAICNLSDAFAQDKQDKTLSGKLVAVRSKVIIIEQEGRNIRVPFNIGTGISISAKATKDCLAPGMYVRVNGTLGSGKFL